MVECVKLFAERPIGALEAGDFDELNWMGSRFNELVAQIGLINFELEEVIFHRQMISHYS